MESYRELFVFILLSAGFSATVKGQCDGYARNIIGQPGAIKSPNFDNGGEYGKTANCSWVFNPPSREDEYALVLTVTRLKLFVVNGGKKHCLGSYNLSLNHEQTKCDRYVHEPFDGSPPGPANDFCNAYYTSPTCANLNETQGCETKQQTSFPVSVTYFSDGRRDASTTSENMYFKIQYKFIECPKGPTTTSRPATTETLVESIPTTISDAVQTPTSDKHEETSSTAKQTSMNPAAVTKQTNVTTPTGIGGKQQDVTIIIATVSGGVIATVCIAVIVVVCKRRGRAGSEKSAELPIDDKTNTGRPETDQSEAATYENMKIQSNMTVGTHQSGAEDTNDTLGGAVNPLYEVMSEPQSTPQPAQLPGDGGYAQISDPSGGHTYSNVGGAAGTNQSESKLYSDIL